MSLATKVLEALQSVTIGDRTISPATVNTALQGLLQEYGYADVGIQSHVDLNDGIYVKFTKDSEDVVVLFTYHEGYAKVVVVSEDDDQIEIDLRALDPVVIKLGAVDMVDLTDINWMNKSVISALLGAGRITESEEVFVMSGNRKVKLPIIKRNSVPTDFYLKCRDKVKNIEWQ